MSTGHEPPDRKGAKRVALTDAPLAKRVEPTDDNPATAFTEIHHPKKRAFLSAFARLGTVTHAAQAAGCSRHSHGIWLAADEQYRAAFAEAKQAACDELERAARERALSGKSDLLTMFLMKSFDRERFADRIDVRTESTNLHVHVAAGTIPEWFQAARETSTDESREQGRPTIEHIQPARPEMRRTMAGP